MEALFEQFNHRRLDADLLIQFCTQTTEEQIVSALRPYKGGYSKHAVLVSPQRATELIGIRRVIMHKKGINVIWALHSLKRHSPFRPAGSLQNAMIVKPAIHYLQICRIGDKIIFSPNKILLAKTRWTCCCTLFVVRRQFLCSRRFFFRRKNSCVCQRDHYPDTNPAYSVRWKLVRETWRKPFIHYSPYVVFSSFCHYFAVVRE